MVSICSRLLWCHELQHYHLVSWRRQPEGIVGWVGCFSWMLDTGILLVLNNSKLLGMYKSYLSWDAVSGHFYMAACKYVSMQTMHIYMNSRSYVILSVSFQVLPIDWEWRWWEVLNYGQSSAVLPEKNCTFCWFISCYYGETHLHEISRSSHILWPVMVRSHWHDYI